MGRVSKHKKIKSCDPFYKGPRANPVRKGDLPPDNDEDQPPPKAFLRFLRYNEHISNKISSRAKTTAIKRSKLKSKGGGVSAQSAESPVSESRDISISFPNNGNIPEGASLPGGHHKDMFGSGTSDTPLPEGRAAMFVRRPGESMQTYLERIDIESKNRIVDCFRKERKKSGRRKQ